MANSKAISIRIPDELLEKIDQLAEEKYKSHKGTPNRSLVVLDAIVAYFDTLSDTSKTEDTISVSDSVSTVEFNALRDAVSTLSDSVKQLQSKLIIPSDTVEKSGKNTESDWEDKKPKQGQLDILTVSDSDGILNGKELSERLDVSQKWVSTNKDNPKFAELSKDRDPESISWSYNPETKKFSPVKPLA